MKYNKQSFLLLLFYGYYQEKTICWWKKSINIHKSAIVLYQCLLCLFVFCFSKFFFLLYYTYFCILIIFFCLLLIRVNPLRLILSSWHPWKLVIHKKWFTGSSYHKFRKKKQEILFFQNGLSTLEYQFFSDFTSELLCKTEKNTKKYFLFYVLFVAKFFSLFSSNIQL